MKHFTIPRIAHCSESMGFALDIEDSLSPSAFGGFGPGSSMRSRCATPCHVDPDDPNKLTMSTAYTGGLGTSPYLLKDDAASFDDSMFEEGDNLPHPFQVMDKIVSVANGKTVILVDGGFRRGSDAFKGLAFGATLVGLGRPILYGLAANKNEGVKEVVQQMTQEMKRLISMTGFTSPGKIGRDSLIEY